jgi:hypothetical protein
MYQKYLVAALGDKFADPPEQRGLSRSTPSPHSDIKLKLAWNPLSALRMEVCCNDNVRMYSSTS